MSTSFDPAENELPQVPPAEATEATEASGNSETINHLNDETARDGEREQHTYSDTDEPSAPRRNRRARGTRATHGERPGANSDGILHLPVHSEHQSAEQCSESEESNEAAAVAELEAQGFTADEAIQLVHVSDRVAVSREAREAEATLRRLRFTRWLIERGVLDEFSA